MGKHVLVVGSINMDYVIYTDRVPKLGETVTGRNFAMNYGGKGANQAVAAAKQGMETKMLGSVGTDMAGELARKNLESYSIDCRDVFVSEGSTGAAVITVSGADNHIILDAGANGKVTPEEIGKREALFDWADAVILQYEIPTESVIYAAKLAKKYGCLVILNPAPVKKIDEEIYQYIDLIVPNEFEAGLITGVEVTDSESAKTALRKLKELGCRQALITLGKHGCAYFDGEEIKFAPIMEVKAVDTTAAGDSFIGGMCTMLCRGKSMDEAVRYATAVSALAVSRKGAAVSIPTGEEVLAFLEQEEKNRK